MRQNPHSSGGGLVYVFPLPSPLPLDDPFPKSLCGLEFLDGGGGGLGVVGDDGGVNLLPLIPFLPGCPFPCGELGLLSLPLPS